MRRVKTLLRCLPPFFSLVQKKTPREASLSSPLRLHAGMLHAGYIQLACSCLSHHSRRQNSETAPSNHLHARMTSNRKPRFFSSHQLHLSKKKKKSNHVFAFMRGAAPHCHEATQASDYIQNAKTCVNSEKKSGKISPVTGDNRVYRWGR